MLPVEMQLINADEPVPYGAPIDLATAKKVMAAAETEAKKNNWPVVIAIVDAGGHLVLLERLDNTQWGECRNCTAEGAHGCEISSPHTLLGRTHRQRWS